jgi:hypothetical protein
MTYFQAIANELQEAIDRVRELHKEHDGYCGYCRYYFDGAVELSARYPCKTIKALNNEVQ